MLSIAQSLGSNGNRTKQHGVDVFRMIFKTTDPIHRLRLGSLIFAMAGVAAIFIDAPVSEYLQHQKLPGEIRKLFDFSEVFAHGMGVALIIFTIGVLDRKHRRAIGRVLACAYGAGIAANIAKLIVGRTRPRAFDFESNILNTFTGWLPVLSETTWTSDIQSFPSAHTATATGLAIGLTWLYPHGKHWFMVLALLATFQRIVSQAHHPSDTFFGAAIACLTCSCFFSIGPLSRWFDHWEQSSSKTDATPEAGR